MSPQPTWQRLRRGVWIAAPGRLALALTLLASVFIIAVNTAFLARSQVNAWNMMAAFLVLVGAIAAWRRARVIVLGLGTALVVLGIPLAPSAGVFPILAGLVLVVAGTLLSMESTMGPRDG